MFHCKDLGKMLESTFEKDQKQQFKLYSCVSVLKRGCCGNLLSKPTVKGDGLIFTSHTFFVRYVHLLFLDEETASRHLMGLGNI